MTVYAVILNDPDETAWRKVREWKQHYVLTDRIAFIATDDLTLTHEIAATIGINREGGVTGLVLESTNRAGWNDSALIEWLGKVS